jgi:hypothetical protein
MTPKVWRQRAYAELVLKVCNILDISLQSKNSEQWKECLLFSEIFIFTVTHTFKKSLQLIPYRMYINEKYYCIPCL